VKKPTERPGLQLNLPLPSDPAVAIPEGKQKVGFSWGATGMVEKTPDLRVQDAIQMVFAKMTQLGSIRQVLLWFRQEKICLPALPRDPLGQPSQNLRNQGQPRPDRQAKEVNVGRLRFRCKAAS
jgi:hypothetical protein